MNLSPAPLLSQFRYLIRSARITQWIKNLFVFAPLFFGEMLFNNQLFLDALVVFIAFCLVSSGTYLINDVVDFERDLHHIYKKHRPIASGVLSRRHAFYYAGLCWVAGLGLVAKLEPTVVAILVSYIVFNIAYSLWLKNIFVLDVVSVTIGFILRIYAGATAVSIPPSVWLLMTTCLLALFLALSKRKTERATLNEDAIKSRPVLVHYHPKGLDRALRVLAILTIGSYTGYAVSKVNQYPSLMVMVILVMYGLYRYLGNIDHDQNSSDPLDIIFSDFHIWLTFTLWLAGTIIIVYL